MGRVGPVPFEVFLVGRTCVCVLVDGTGSCLSEKEFRVMIAKMIQNLENKMEAQIYRLEA